MSTLTTEVPKISLYRRDELRNDTPLAVVVESFFVSNSMKPKTHDFYSTHLRAFGDFIKDRSAREAILSDVNHDYVNQYIRMLEVKPTVAYPKGSPFRARAATTTLKRFANWLIADGVLQGESPLKKVKKTKELRDVRQPLSDEELGTIIDAAGLPGERNRTIVVFMAATGLRLNEARELRVSDLHLRDGQVTIRAETCKVGVARTVVFHDAIAKEVDKYLRTHDRKSEDPLFPTDEGTAFKEDSFGKIFQRLAQESGVRRFHAHLLRHTWATNFMRQPGADLLQLKRQGGWSRMDMVERYSHAIPVRDRSALPNPLAMSGKVIAFARVQ